jgi:hypothetical protein
MQVGYRAGGKYCRRCEYYFFTERLFCECCGMRLRASPANREFKEKVRAKKKTDFTRESSYTGYTWMLFFFAALKCD